MATWLGCWHYHLTIQMQWMLHHKLTKASKAADSLQQSLSKSMWKTIHTLEELHWLLLFHMTLVLHSFQQIYPKSMIQENVHLFSQARLTLPLSQDTLFLLLWLYRRPPENKKLKVLVLQNPISTRMLFTCHMSNGLSEPWGALILVTWKGTRFHIVKGQREI